jgi:hypothetical protein
VSILIPYGVRDFKVLKKSGSVFADKTKFIAQLEETTIYPSLFRPRGFGKTLFISMLEYYYDYRHEKSFEAIFENTWIGSNPTEEKTNSRF